MLIIEFKGSGGGDIHFDTHTHTHIYIYIYIYIWFLSETLNTEMQETHSRPETQNTENQNIIDPSNTKQILT